MELAVVLWLLYGLQCVSWLPGGAVLFVRPLRAWSISSGPGWRLLHPLPSGRSWIGRRLPVVAEEGRLFGRGGASWLSGRGWAEEVPMEGGALAGAAADADAVRVDGRLFARAASPAHAAEWAHLLRELSGDDAGAARGAEKALAESLSLARLEETRRRVEATTRWLGRVGDVYAAALLVLLPAAMPLVGAERALVLAAPPLALLHLLTLVLFARAHRTLHAGGRGALVEALVSVALYPPLLLRARTSLCTRELGRFHPAAIAAACLPREAARAFLRCELLRAAQREGRATPRDGAVSLDALERRALESLVRELGESLDALLAPPPRDDPTAASYCPACLCDYRSVAGSCTDCGIALVAYELG